MYIYIFLFIFFIITEYIFIKLKNKDNDINYDLYTVQKNPMTDTELKFLKILQNVTNKYNLIVIPQIQIQNIFKTNSTNAFNRIKAKSVDFAIVDKNYDYKLFIELDDYTHNRTYRIKRDVFVNNLFERYNLKLIRIDVKNTYNYEKLDKLIQENL